MIIYFIGSNVFIGFGIKYLHRICNEKSKLKHDKTKEIDARVQIKDALTGNGSV